MIITLLIKKIDWKSALESLHPDTAWNMLTDILRNGMDLCIPKIKIRSDFQPIGYDSECHRKCKERCHKRYKATDSLQDGLKFASTRKEFRRLVCKKMRDNLYIYEDTNLISKKFWTYVKRASKSNRIPEILTCGNTVSSDTKTKADMLNKFFYEQFSEPSMYDTDICFSTDNEFDINFNPS